MRKIRDYTDEQIIEIAKSATSKAEILRLLSLKAAGGNYRVLDSNLKRLKIDTSHFLGGGWAKGRKLVAKRGVEEYLFNQQKITSHHLKRRLIKEGYLWNLCYECGKTPEWRGKPLVHELDHIDGDSSNNNLSNLRLLCCFCHSQTDTYRGKNKKPSEARIIAKEKKQSQGRKIPKPKKYICTECNVSEISWGAKKCLPCSKLSQIKQTKITWPESVILDTLVKLHGRSKVGRMLGVSDTAIKKRLKKYPPKIETDNALDSALSVSCPRRDSNPHVV